MTPYLLLALALLSLAVYILARSLQAARQRARIAEGKAEAAEARERATMTEFAKREAERHALETELAALRSGTPSARLDASVSVLRDEARAISGASPDIVADPPRAPRGHRPR